MLALWIGLAGCGRRPQEWPINDVDRAVFYAPESAPIGTPPAPADASHAWEKTWYGHSGPSLWHVDHFFGTDRSDCDGPERFGELSVWEAPTRAQDLDDARRQFKSVDLPPTRGPGARCGEVVTQRDEVLQWGDEHWCFQMQAAEEPHGEAISCAARKGTLVIMFDISGVSFREPGSVDAFWGDRLAALEMYVPTPNEGGIP